MDFASDADKADGFTMSDMEKAELTSRGMPGRTIRKIRERRASENASARLARMTAETDARGPEDGGPEYTA